MRLARKLILATVIGLAVVFAANAYYRIRRERFAFDSDMRQDHAVLAQVLREAVADMWKKEGRQAALDLLAAVGSPSESVRVRWIDKNDTAARVTGKDRYVTNVSVCIAGECPGLIEISESRASADR